MASVQSLMTKCDPRMEKENMVPRVQRSEPGSAGYSTGRARGLTSSEHRSSTVLKESLLQNVAPAPVNPSKGNVGFVEKDRLKMSSSDLYKGKATTESLERLMEKIGQLKNASAPKQQSQRTPSTNEPHPCGESNPRGSTPTGTESKGHIYRDVKVSNSGGYVKENSKIENQRRIREINAKIGSMSVLEPAMEQVPEESVRTISPSTPAKSIGKEKGTSVRTRALATSTFSRSSNGTPYKKKLSTLDGVENTSQSLQNKVEGAVESTHEKHHGSSYLVIEKEVVKDVKGLLENGLDLHGRSLRPLSSETTHTTNHAQGEEKGSHEHPVEHLALPSSGLLAGIEKPSNIIKRAKCSRYGPALRVRRDDPRFPNSKDDHSPGSETSADNGQRSPEVLPTSKHDDNSGRSNTAPKAEIEVINTGHQQKKDDEIQHGEDHLLDLRKRKAEADPSTTDTSLLLSGVTGDKQISGAVAMETQKDGLPRGGHTLDHEVFGGISGRESRTELTALEQSGECLTAEFIDRPLTGSSTKGTPGTEREPWAWKRDPRAHTSPTLPEHSKSAKSINGIPPRYVHPSVGSREPGSRRGDLSDSPALDAHKPYAGVARQLHEIDRSESSKAVTPQPKAYEKGVASTEDAAVNHLSNTLSTITIGEKSALDGHSKHSVQGRTQTQMNGHHLNFAPAESGSLSGLTGVTGLSGITSQSLGHTHKSALPSSHGVEVNSISAGEKGASGLAKHTSQGRTPTQALPQQMNAVRAESVSVSGVTGMTGQSGVTSQSVGTSQKPLPQGTEVPQKSHLPQTMKESVRSGAESIDQNGHSKVPTRANVALAEVPSHEAHEGHSTKSSDAPKERGDKNQDNPPPYSQPQRRPRMETENDNFVYVNGIRYQKLGKIGKGGSSEVFKVIATNCSIYALKRINLKGRDWGSAREFYQEIEYLEALRGKRHIIQLVDSEVTNKKVLDKSRSGGDITEDAFIYMVLEYGEIDLAGMLSAKRKEMQSNNESKLDENWLRFYWQQILEAVRTIHEERIVHSDLKPANFMLVRGELKLIDFGIAKAIQNDTTNIVRDSQAGTLNYMSPEACLQNQTDDEGMEIKQGRASDIWSLGCILYQMVYGQTPFAELSFYSKIQAITNPHHKIIYPPVSNPWLLDIMKRCLTWDRRKRLRIPELLQHPFLQPHLAPVVPIRHLLINGMSKDQILQNVAAEISACLPSEWVAELLKREWQDPARASRDEEGSKDLKEARVMKLRD